MNTHQRPKEKQWNIRIERYYKEHIIQDLNQNQTLWV